MEWDSTPSMRGNDDARNARGERTAFAVSWLGHQPWSAFEKAFTRRTDLEIKVLQDRHIFNPWPARQPVAAEAWQSTLSCSWPAESDGARTLEVLPNILGLSQESP